MKRQLTSMLALMLLASPSIAQQDSRPPRTPAPAHGVGTPVHGSAPAVRPRANQGHIPEPPQRGPRVTTQPEHLPGGRVNGVPHVNHDHWYAHDAPGDPRYRLDRPFAHGHFEHVGPRYRYPFVRVDAGLHRFWLPANFYFDVAPWDWPLVGDWCLDCGDDYVIYPDDDHPGWYLIYNIHTGQYVHAQYMGA